MLKTMRVGAYGILNDDSRRTLMRRMPDTSGLSDSWCLPGGTVAHGEDPADTVVRAFAEQTGVEVKVCGVRKVAAAVMPLTEEHTQHSTLLVYEVESVGGKLQSHGDAGVNTWVEESSLDGERMTVDTATMLGCDNFEAVIEQSAEPEPKPNQVQRVGVYGWITDESGRVLITLISEGFPAAGKWHLPGGGLDFGEQPSQSLLREIVEETSQEAELVGLRVVDSRRNPNAVNVNGGNEDFQGIHIIYDAKIADPGPLEILDVGGSTSQVRWMSPEELRTLPITPAVEAALTD